MAINFLSNFNFNQNEIQNARIQSLATAPSAPLAGQIYFDTALSSLRYYAGTEWVTVNDFVLAPATASALGGVKVGTGLSMAEDGTLATIGMSDEQITAAITAQINGLIADAPDALNTLKELADALGDQSNFAAQMTTNLAKKVDKIDGKGLSTNDLTNELLAILNAKSDKFAQDIGDGTATSIAVKHGLGTQDVTVTVRSTISPYSVVICDMAITDENTVTLAFTNAPTSGQYRVVVMG